jgi:Flp pilus assembly CpaF family ATPase
LGALGTVPGKAHDPHSEASELVQRLCLEPGRIMEDESPALAMALPADGYRLAATVARARQAGEDIAALARPLKVIPTQTRAVT